MQNIKKIYKRLTKIMVKKKTLLIFIAIQNVILTLIVLMYTNMIISNAKASGELNYQQIKFFYNLMMMTLVLLSYIYAPYFLAGSINSMKKNNTIVYMLATKVKINEMIYASYLRGIIAIFTLLISAFPIMCVSFYFGGVGVYRVMKFVVFLLIFMMLFSSICIYLSTFIKDSNLSILVSYIIGLIVLLLHLVYMRKIIDDILLLCIYSISFLIVTIVFLFLSSKSHIMHV